MGDVYGGFDTATAWVETAPRFFARLDREHYLAFIPDDDGRLYLCSAAGYHGCYGRIAWYETSSTNFVLLGTCMAIFLATVIILGLRVRGLVRMSWRVRIAWGNAWMCSALFLTGIGGTFYALFIRRVAGLPAFAAGVSPLAGVMLGLLSVGAALSLGLVPAGILAWREGHTRSRLAYAGFTTTALMFTGWLHYWNLILA
jgi:hypothetical protein